MLVSLQNLSFPAPAKGFVVIEGVNGAGKSTLQKGLADFVRERGLQPRCTREPGATKLGLSIRSILLESDIPRPHLSELFLFAADRASHVAEVIKPALERGEVVISDRYFYSTTAFQGYGRGIDMRAVNDINLLATSGLVPDLVFLLDLDAREGLKRSARRASQTAASSSDSFEKEQLSFHERIRAGFLEIAKSRNEPFVVMDASLPAQQILHDARLVLDKLLGARSGRR